MREVVGEREGFEVGVKNELWKV